LQLQNVAHNTHCRPYIRVMCLFYTGFTKTAHFTCAVCDKRFTTKGYLNVHRKRHTGENLYPCTQCENCFSSRIGLCHHMNIHRGKYKCTECGRCHQSSRHLARHRQSHIRRETVWMYCL